MRCQILALLFLLTLALQASGQAPPKYPVEQYTLPNGLRVVLSEDHSVPQISLVVGYDVGSRNEPRGKTGFAHLFEHMMFQGSANVERNGHARYIEGAGGIYNGSTHDEMTLYECMVPSEKLPLVLWMEADRMRALNVTAENFANQKDVVKEEKRLRFDNAPYTEAFNKINELAFANFSNQHSSIGSMSDLENASLEYVQTFFKTYYVPNNAVLTLVGDFNPAQAKTLIEQYFGSLPRKADPPKRNDTETELTKGKNEVITDKFAEVPATILAWRGPALDSPDYEPLNLAFTLIFKQISGRAAGDIGGGEQQWIYNFQGGPKLNKGPSLFQVFALHRSDITAERVKNEVQAQISRLQDENPPKDEMERVRTYFLASLYRSKLEPLNERAKSLTEYALKWGEAKQFYESINRYLTTPPARLSEVAKKYLKPELCSQLEVKTTRSPQTKEDEP